MLYKQTNVKKYTITHEGLELLISAKGRSQELFLDILYRIGYENKLDAIIVECNYKDLSFKSHSNFRKYRDELVQRDLLFYEKNQFYVNPIYFNFYTRRQQNFFFKLFSIKTEIKVLMKEPVLLKVM